MSPAPIIQFRVSSGPLPVSLPFAVEAPTDHDLMIAVRAGEIRRLGDLFERHNRRLYGFFVRLTNQPAVSEDLVQIVFYRILKYRHTYRDEGKFSAWFYHLARKVAADHFRKHASTPAPTDPAELHEEPDAEPQPSEQAATAEDVTLLRAALARLPLEHREVLVLSRLQHLEHKEIARLLDCSVGAVKVRAHRALKELRDVYFKIRKEKAA
ncbi:MAG TPA: sigma-70 family RNA polymerase sigma factor [Lacunisphaera sp.]|jgi:RNA polymerase sigma-70 factor (ECF subfamily)|nr:sigma-70 family RNA polymerase sigma factor [Lacunisphaera sp.]